MNNRIFRISAVAVTVLALVLNGFAQQPPRASDVEPSDPGGFRMLMGFGMMGLAGPDVVGVALEYRNPEINKILELTPEQTPELQKIAGGAKKTIEQFKNVSPPLTTEELKPRVATALTETQEKVDKILKPEQRKKLREISFQLAGGLSSPLQNVQTFEAFDLTDTQKEQIRKLMEERHGPARRTIISEITNSNPPIPREEAGTRIRAAMEQMDARFTEQIKSLLTTEQRAKAEKLTAEIPVLQRRMVQSLREQPHAAGGER